MNTSDVVTSAIAVLALLFSVYTFIDSKRAVKDNERAVRDLEARIALQELLAVLGSSLLTNIDISNENWHQGFERLQEYAPISVNAVHKIDQAPAAASLHGLKLALSNLHKDTMALREMGERYFRYAGTRPQPVNHFLAEREWEELGSAQDKLRDYQKNAKAVQIEAVKFLSL